MQHAGLNCPICGDKIISDAEGIGCHRCKTSFHTECLRNANDQCPVCKVPVDRLDAHYHFSAFCPECVTPTSESQERCSQCGAWTRWDDRAAYEAFLIRHRKYSRNLYARGIGEIVIGTIALLLFITALSWAFAAIGLLALPKGIWDIKTARCLLSFR